MTTIYRLSMAVKEEENGMPTVDWVIARIYDEGMRKGAPLVIREVAITTLDKCPTDESPMKVRIDIGDGYCKPKFKYCDTCGTVKEIAKDAKPVPSRRV